MLLNPSHLKKAKNMTSEVNNICFSDHDYCQSTY